MTPMQKQELAARLKTFDHAGFIRPPDVGAFVQWTGSIVGKDAGIFAQLAPIVLRGLVSDSVLEAWVALSGLHCHVYARNVDDMDRYVSDMESLAKNMIEKVAHVDYGLLGKLKFHLVLHLPEQSRNMGPPRLVAVESNEGYNQPIKTKIFNSNKRSASRDIAAAFMDWRTLRHIACGGYWMAANGSYVSPGQGITEICNSKHILAILRALPRKARENWEPYERCRDAVYANTLVGLDMERDIAKLQSYGKIRQPDGHVLKVNGFCMAQDNTVWRVEGIYSHAQLGGAGSTFIHGRKLSFDGGMEAGCPTLTISDKFAVVNVHTLKGLVNVQHDCKRDGCRFFPTNYANLPNTYGVQKIFGHFIHADAKHYIMNVFVLGMPWLAMWRNVPSTNASMRDRLEIPFARWQEQGAPTWDGKTTGKGKRKRKVIPGIHARSDMRKKGSAKGKEIARADNSEHDEGGPSNYQHDLASAASASQHQSSMADTPAASPAYQHSLASLIYQQSLVESLAHQHSLAGSYYQQSTGDTHVTADAELLQWALALQGVAPPNIY